MTTSTRIDADPDRTAAVRAAAAALQEAARTAQPCPPVRTLLPDSTVATGYAVQSVLTRARLDAGRAVTGRKIGLTAPAVQAQLGVDQPDFGVLFDDTEVAGDEPVDFGRLLQPRIEAEIAFILSTDLDDSAGEIDEATARSAVAAVVPALEIVDSRIAGWDITIVDTVADNASAGLYVLGDTRTGLGDTDLRDVRMTLTGSDGRVLSTGAGADCLGDPVAALVWLARTAREFGDPLRAGEVVLSGALGPMTPVGPGDEFTATLTGLGEVRARFTTGGGAA